MTPAQLQYFAGFFDAEGSIILRCVNGHRLGLRLKLDQVKPEILQRLHRQLNQGHLRSSNRGKAYTLVIYAARDLAILLPRLIPNSLGKRAQLQEALRWLQVRNPNSRRRLQDLKLRAPRLSRQFRCSWPYLAGWIDGDGSLGRRRPQGWALSLSQKYPSILLRFQRFLKVRLKPCANNTGTYLFRVCRRNDLRRILRRLEPHFIRLRSNARQALQELA